MEDLVACTAFFKWCLSLQQLFNLLIGTGLGATQFQHKIRSSHLDQ